MVLVNTVLGCIEKTYFFTKEKKVKNNIEEVSFIFRGGFTHYCTIK